MKNIDIDNIFKLGIALSAEKDNAKLFGMILNEAIDLTGSDAGTIYILEENQLYFNYMITRSKGVDKSADRGEINIPPVPLGRGHVCACCALDKQLINIADIYYDKMYDFSGAQKYDALNGYRTRSMLVVPMLDETEDCIGVLQLINAGGSDSDIIYNEEDENIIRALASFAAVSLNARLMQEVINDLLHSFVTVMVGAIDTRSPYNANHTKSMVKYGERFLEWLDSSDSDFNISKKDRDPFLMSIWLHDIGKLLIPLDVMDKATRLGEKLETINNRITIAILMEKLSGREENITGFIHIRELIDKVNGMGFLPDDLYEEVATLSEKMCLNENGETIRLITDEELKSLLVRKGTLTEAERRVMESHVEYTNKMLSGMKFSGRYKNVANIAAGHHELIDGTGYPNRISGEDVNAQTRLLTILDIYDALTAEDRPYKPPLPTQKAFAILEDMANEGKIDKGILELFKKSGAWDKNNTF